MKTNKIKIIIILLLIFSSFSYAQQNPFMDYVLSWDGESSILEVELTYSVSQKDSTVFIFGDPDFGGQNDIFNTIKNIRVSKPEELRLDEANRRITVFHNGAKKNKISYEIDGSFNVDKPTVASQTELFRPVITKGMLTMVNIHFTMKITDESNPLVSFSWHKYPENFTYFNSVQPSQKNPSMRFTDNYDKLSHILYFVMGDNIDVKEYNVMGVPYYCVTTIEDRYGNDLQGNFIPFFESYFPSIHRFWNDTDFPFYSLTVTALQNNQKEIGAGGFGIKNGFVMKLGKKFDTREKYVTAHETSHSWIGIKMMLGHDSFDNQWFGEGFNDYITIINLANSKIFEKEDFLNYMNEDNFKKHYKSEIKGVHNDSIAAKYWTDYANYGVLPYKRGLIYAFYLDNQIRLASNGKFTLRNMLLDLHALRRTKKHDEILTVDDFIDVGAAYLDKKELAEQIAQHMIEGQPIDFTNIKLIDEFDIEINDGVPKLSLTGNSDLLKIYRW
ncbi:hypothetical protein ACFSKL_11295 [Belliella marina]|uniref:Peptidase M1 membrane alanine aminopeptidase domain-containing protein n=1 Tax=Belliella marina TaxID=1644146 RepID=A0ABW4VPB7_9BACT